MATTVHVRAQAADPDRAREAPPGGVRTGGAPARTLPADWSDAVRDAYQWHHDRLIGFFFRRTKDRPMAEDLAHDTFLRFAASADRFDPARPVWPYLKAVAHNVLIDHFRRDARQVVADVDEHLIDQAEPGIELDDTIVLRSLLDRALRDLPERQRIAVELRCERGWEVPDAAEFLGITPGTFSQLLFRARRSLQVALDQSGARVNGLVVPALVWLRLRTREATDRVREIAQTPATAMSGEAIASVLVAATIGVTAVAAGVAASSADAEASAEAMSLARHHAAVSIEVSPAQEPIVEIPPASATAVDPTSDASLAPTDADAPTEPRTTTILKTPDAIQGSRSTVEATEDDDSLVIEGHSGISTGDLEVGATGPILTVDCETPETTLVCDAVPHSSSED